MSISTSDTLITFGIAFSSVVFGAILLTLLILVLRWATHSYPACAQCLRSHSPLRSHLTVCPYRDREPSVLRLILAPLIGHPRAGPELEAELEAAFRAARAARAARGDEQVLSGTRQSIRPRSEEIDYWNEVFAPPVPVYSRSAPAHHIVVYCAECGPATSVPSYRSPAPSYKSVASDSRRRSLGRRSSSLGPGPSFDSHNSVESRFSFASRSSLESDRALATPVRSVVGDEPAVQHRMTVPHPQRTLDSATQVPRRSLEREPTASPEERMMPLPSLPEPAALSSVKPPHLDRESSRATI